MQNILMVLNKGFIFFKDNRMYSPFLFLKLNITSDMFLTGFIKFTQQHSLLRLKRF